MILYFQFYEKHTEINNTNVPITQHTQIYKCSNGLIFSTNSQDFSIVFKKEESIAKFLACFLNYDQIDSVYLQIFKDSFQDIQKKLSYFEYFIEMFDCSRQLDQITVLFPFIYILSHEPDVFQHVFENMFFQHYT